MAALIYLDTHVVAWLYAGRGDLFPERALRRLDRSELLISPIVTLELEYLFELGRTAEPGRVVVETLERDLGLRLCDLRFASVVTRALGQSWTRDPFDRILVGHAETRGAALLTRDETIRAHYPLAVWDAE